MLLVFVVSIRFSPNTCHTTKWIHRYIERTCFAICFAYFLSSATQYYSSLCSEKKRKSHHFTMLQKLSICEVKARHYQNLITLLPLRFYVKSNFSEFKPSKNVIFGNFRDSELWIFDKFGT